MPSPNTLPIFSGLFTATAPTINIPITAPQIGDEANASLVKINALLAGGAASVPAATSGSYTAVSPFYSTTTGAGTTPASLTSFSFTSQSASATFNGVSVPSGTTLNFDADPGTKFSPVSYDGGGGPVFVAGSQLV